MGKDGVTCPKCGGGLGMTEIEQALKTVEALNNAGFAASGFAPASITASEFYTSINCGGRVLWDSEGNHRADIDFCEDEGNEPTVETCLRVLRDMNFQLRLLIRQLEEDLE